jgi:pseudouridine synthase
MHKIKPKSEYLKKVKLDRFLSREGICSRSEAIQLAADGLIFVNGVLVSDVDKRIDAKTDSVEIKPGKKDIPSLVTIIYKPRGIVSQIMKTPVRPANSLLTADTFASYIKGKTVHLDHIIKNKKSFFPLGSLEKESHGLLVMTNDKKLIKKMTNFEIYLEREFIIQLDKPLHKKLLEKIYKGSVINEFLVKPKKLELEEGNTMRLTLHSDFKNQIYQLIGRAGVKPLDIQCVRIGKFEIGTLKPGQWIVVEQTKDILGR